MNDPSLRPDPNIAVTTVEDSARKPLVQPYGEVATVELGLGVVACPFCGNPQFRRSRIRFTDLLEIVLFRLPVRCTRCSKRQYRDYFIAMLAYPPKMLGPRAGGQGETWKNWTDPSQPSSSARPVSTALGPRARRLEPLNKVPRPAPPTGVAPRRHEDDIW